MYQNKAPATRTELHVLSDILQKIEMGEIRVPAFQRDFIWDKPKVRDLFQSVYSAYPIGSILLLRTSNKSLEAKLNSIPFPPLEVIYPTTFVIDGVQRLSALYGTLIYHRGQESGTVWALAFDLREEKFQHSNSGVLKPWMVWVSSLFSYDDFLLAQQSLIQHNDRELYRRYMHLYNVFHQYQIPAVTIEDRSLEEVAEIFMRINTKGKRLSKPELQSALDWIADHNKE